MEEDKRKVCSYYLFSKFTFRFPYIFFVGSFLS
jgi:hypothetical protein